MLAEDFGYQLSPRPAKAMTPKIQDAVDKARKDAANAIGSAQDGSAAAVAIFFAGIILALIVQQPWIVAGSTVLALVIGGAGASAAATAKAKAKVAEQKVREMVTPVLSGHWQAWPSRMEAVAGQQRRRVLLLDPKGGVAVTFLSAVPDAAWLSMTDGRGLVWFVGDLRFGGMMALPGGRPVWWTGAPVVSQKSPESSSGLSHVVEEELARQAVKFVFDKWLG